MGGTSEARDLVEHLDVSKIVYATTTRNPAHLARFRLLPQVHLIGPMSCAQIVKVIKDYEIKRLVDATHPFAVNASINAIAACGECEIDYFRLERSRVDIPATELIRIISDFDRAARVIREMVDKKRVLLSIGVKHLGYFRELFEDPEYEVYCQVLDIPESLEMAGRCGIPLDRVLAADGVPTMENVHRILMDFQLDLMVFKESGYQGGTDAKIEAGMITKTPMILIDRPQISYPAAFESVEDLVSSLVKKK
jgi:precorrin-6A/cobalt-precorrin-6A reductase